MVCPLAEIGHWNQMVTSVFEFKKKNKLEILCELKQRKILDLFV